MVKRCELGFVVLLIIYAGLGSGCAAIPNVSYAPTPSPTREESIPPGAVKMTPEQDPTPPILHVTDWDQPVPVDGVVNTAGAEDSAFVTPDGKTLYFFFTPDVSVPPEQQLLDGVTGIYVAHNVNGEWTNATRVILQEPGSLALDGCEMVQGDIMWFCSAREGYTGVNLFTAELVDGQWKNWQYSGNTLNLDYEVGEMHATADGQELYFHSLREGGKGDLDIWVTQWRDGSWQPPENVQSINSPDLDGWPFVTQDGGELWFTRMYQGSPAIFRSKKVDGQWTVPELIISQFAGEPSVDDAGNIYFTHHYFSGGTMIEADLYVAYRK